MARSGTSRLRIFLIAMAAIVGVTVFVLPGRNQSYVPDDPLGVEFLGLVAAGDDVLYGSAGERAGRYECACGSPAQWRGANGQFRRDFVFRLPPSPEPMVCLMPRITVSGTGEIYPINDMQYSNHNPCLDWHSGTTISLPVIFDKPGRAAFSSIPPKPTKVDITFRYYLGRPNPAECVFQGPFTMGSTITHPQQPKYILTIQPGSFQKRGSGSPRIHSTRFLVKAVKVRIQPEMSVNGDPTLVVVAYDKQGRRYLLIGHGGSVGGHYSWKDNLLIWLKRGRGVASPSRFTYSYSFDLEEIPLQDVAAIAVNEIPHERTFHGVPFSPHGGAEGDHMAYLDALADRLGVARNAGQMFANLCVNPRNVAGTIDMMREYHLVRAAKFLTQAGAGHAPENFTPAELERIRAAAAKAVGSAQEPTRRAGVTLGLWGGWPEFLAPALELLERPRPPIPPIDLANEVIVLQLCKKLDGLGEPQVQQLVRHLAVSKDSWTRNTLLNEIKRRDRQPQYAKALVWFAKCDTPWLWRSVIDPMMNPSGIISGDIRKEALESRVVRLRAVALGFEAIVPEAGGLAAEAYGLLPGMIGMDLVENYCKNTSAEVRVINQVEKHLPRAEATRLFVTLMRQMVAREWEALHRTNLDMDFQMAVEEMIRALNRLHGTKLGGLGEKRPPGGLNDNWPDLAREAIGRFGGP